MVRFAIPNVSGPHLLERIAHGNAGRVQIDRRHWSFYRLVMPATAGDIALVQAVMADVLREHGQQIAPDDVSFPATTWLPVWLIDEPNSRHAWFVCRDLDTFEAERVLETLVESLLESGIETEVVAEADPKWQSLLGN